MTDAIDAGGTPVTAGSSAPAGGGFLNSLLSGGLGAFTASTTAGTASDLAKLNSKNQLALAQSQQANSASTTKLVIIGGILVAIIAVLFVFKKK